MSITAVVLTRGAYQREWPGIEVLVHRSDITDAVGLQRARFDAVARVRTQRFFYLDDDDDLPAGHLQLLEHCADIDAPLVYTDEIVAGKRRSGCSYSQAHHIRHPMLVHHLALYRTAAAAGAVRDLPRGHYAPEFMLAWQVAKGGAAYVPEIGYVWNRTKNGMSNWPCTSLSWVRAMLWCKENP